MTAGAATVIGFAAALWPVGAFPVPGNPTRHLPLPVNAVPAGALFGAENAVHTREVISTSAILDGIKHHVPVLRELLMGPVLAYVLAFALMAVLSTAFAARIGPSGLTVASTVFALASALGAAATTDTVLLATRAVQGSAGAVMVVTALLALLELVPPAHRARTVGIWWLLVASATAAGPAVGSMLLGHIGFDWIHVSAGHAVAGVLVASAALWSIPTPGARARDARIGGPIVRAVAVAVAAAGATVLFPSLWICPLVVAATLGAVAAIRIARLVPSSSSSHSPLAAAGGR